VVHFHHLALEIQYNYLAFFQQITIRKQPVEYKTQLNMRILHVKHPLLYILIKECWLKPNRFIFIDYTCTYIYDRD